jgi:hypothetical protein
VSKTQGCGIYYGCSDLRNVLLNHFYVVLRNDVLIIVSYPFAAASVADDISRDAGSLYLALLFLKD